jgi:SAM-dependent methyltransferase
LHALHNRFLRTPNVTVQRIDPEASGDLAGLENCFDTVLCLNVLEYVEDASEVLERLRATLKAGGKLVVLVPHNRWLYGSLDRSLGHKQRFSERDARELLETRGFTVETACNFNKAGTPPWWAYSKIAGSRKIGKLVLKVFDKTVWIWSRIDGLMPWPGLSLIVVARKNGGVSKAVAECELNQTSSN